MGLIFVVVYLFGPYSGDHTVRNPKYEELNWSVTSACHKRKEEELRTTTQSSHYYGHQGDQNISLSSIRLVNETLSMFQFLYNSKLRGYWSNSSRIRIEVRSYSFDSEPYHFIEVCLSIVKIYQDWGLSTKIKETIWQRDVPGFRD